MKKSIGVRGQDLFRTAGIEGRVIGWNAQWFVDAAGGFGAAALAAKPASAERNNSAKLAQIRVQFSERIPNHE
jgi:hypothetical protein